jgi:hypothetical protein
MPAPGQACVNLMNKPKRINIPTIEPATINEVAIVLRSLSLTGRKIRPVVHGVDARSVV